MVLVLSFDYGSPSGGAIIAEQISRRLAADFTLRVIRFCDERRPGELPWARFADTQSRQFVRHGIPVTQLGPAAPLAPLLRALTRASRAAPPLRLPLSALFYAVHRAALRREIAAADLVHLYYGGLPFAAWRIARLAAGNGVPVVLTPFLHLERQGRTVSMPLRLGSVLLPVLCREAAAVIAMTEVERRWLIDRGVAPARCFVAPGAPSLDPAHEADPDRFRATSGLGGDPIVLFLGRLSRAKGAERLLRAAPLVWRVAPQTRFVFIGPLVEQEVDPRRFTDPRLCFLKAMGAEKADALAACSLLCVPSEAESLGLVYLEAWAFAKPVVALRLPVLETVINDGEDGLLVDPAPEAIARAIVTLLAAPETAKRLGLAGRAKVQRNFVWERSAAQVAAAYRHALGGAALDRARD
ncbi:MAG: glycosyltransferase family 4 protein [Chloroflexota bacterium]|nr:glycosyltransferase family 4 protein [Dehalococcoidia bacterium]MDW8252620.1 glycosyltransferase family 4 protein [Chloroflexota bacterium]